MNATPSNLIFSIYIFFRGPTNMVLPPFLTQVPFSDSFLPFSYQIPSYLLSQILSSLPFSDSFLPSQASYSGQMFFTSELLVKYYRETREISKYYCNIHKKKSFGFPSKKPLDVWKIYWPISVGLLRIKICDYLFRSTNIWKNHFPKSTEIWQEAVKKNSLFLLHGSPFVFGIYT